MFRRIRALPATCTDFVSFLSSVLQREALDGIIHVRGCIHAVNLWMGDNIGATIGICCAVGLPQVLESSFPSCASCLLLTSSYPEIYVSLHRVLFPLHFLSPLLFHISILIAYLFCLTLLSLETPLPNNKL